HQNEHRTRGNGALARHIVPIWLFKRSWSTYPTVKSNVRTLAAWLALAALGIRAAAQDSNPAKDVPPRQSRPARPSGQLVEAPAQRTPTPLLEALDANHDGVIDAEEIDNATAALEALDKNGDGELTEAEYLRSLRPVRPARRPGAPWQRQPAFGP